jgi:O-antigen ligase
MQLMIITGSIVAALSIVAAVFFPSVGLDHDFSYAWQGVCYSKNQFGRTILFLLTPGIHYDRKARGSLWIRSVYIPFMAFLIIMSHSASALVLAFAYLCLAFLVGIVARFSKRELPLLLLSSGILLAILAPLLLINSDSILNLVGRDSSLSGRTVLWKALSLSVAKRPLLGYGYQAFWAGGTSEGTSAMLSTYSAMHWMANYAHSGYLATLLEDGLIGLGMIVLLIGMGIRDAMSCMVRLQEQRYIHWYLGIIFLTILYNVDEITFLVPFYLPWMMLILAVTSLSTEAKRIRIEKLA